MTTVWLDIARLAERATVGTLTGIDRVELAYAQTLRQRMAGDLHYVMLHPLRGQFAAVPRGPAVAFLDRLSRAWRDGEADDCRGAALGLLARAAVAREPEGRDPVYLLVSHRHLGRRKALQQALHRSGAAFVPLLHDVIPITHPEYARPGDADRHAKRLKTVALLASGVMVNSVATQAAIAPYLPPACPVRVAPLGVMPIPPGSIGPEAGRPYFLCVGTIEPRKNHLMLLQVWRRLVETLGAAAPKLELVGGRGWENENVLDLLDRSRLLRGHVTEHGHVCDRHLFALMRGARAVLMPSFAEGFGLPVAEALAAGTPVICSDLPALRETGGGVPDYLDPLDARGWAERIMAYAAASSPSRAAQCRRLAGWRPVTWEAHASLVLAFLGTALVRPAGAAPRRSRPIPLPAALAGEAMFADAFARPDPQPASVTV